MTPMQIVFTLLGIFLLVCFQVWRRRLIKHVKDFNPIPLSRIPDLFRLNFDNTIEIVRSMTDLFPLRTWLSPWQMLVVVSDPDDVHKVLSDPKAADKAYSYKFLKNDHGLLTSEHDVWKAHRKMLNPAFSIGNIRSNMVPVFKEKTDLMLNRMKVIEDGIDCDLLHFIKFCLVETSLATFSGEEDCDKEVVAEYARCMTTRIESVARRFMKIHYHYDTIYELTDHHREEQKCIAMMRNLMKSIMDNYADKYGDAGRTDGRLFIDLLMSRLSDNQITERDVIDELDTITYTSVDTSTHLIIFTLLMIAMHPQVQQDLVNELQSVFYSPEVRFEYDQLKKLDALDRVIKETVRLFPIVPFAVKLAKEPIRLRDSTIPKGVLALIPIMSLHESSDLWGPNVKSFIPERFLPQHSAHRHPHSFIPFSSGRNCIGLIYAKFSMTSVIARILMTYRLDTQLTDKSQIRAQYKITLNLKNKNPFRLIKRNDFYSNN